MQWTGQRRHQFLIFSLVDKEKNSITTQGRIPETLIKVLLKVKKSDNLMNIFVSLSSFHQMMDSMKNSLGTQTCKIMPLIIEPGEQRQGGQKLKLPLNILQQLKEQPGLCEGLSQNVLKQGQDGSVSKVTCLSYS